MIKYLINLANHMDSIGLRKEADYLDSVIFKIAEPEYIMYKVKGGDSLSVIAERHKVTVEQITEDNNISDSDKIGANDTLKIRKNKYNTYTDEDVVAATLLLEVGTTRPESMGAIMKVIKNRSDKTGMSNVQVVLQKDEKGRHQFSCWDNKDILTAINDYRKDETEENMHSSWKYSLGLASGQEPLPDIGGATHYYAKTMSTPPYFANISKNKCWVEIKHGHDPLHIYGIDKSVSYYNDGPYCHPKDGYKK